MRGIGAIRGAAVANLGTQTRPGASLINARTVSVRVQLEAAVTLIVICAEGTPA